MFQISELREIIAERKLRIAGKSNSEIRVLIGKPFPAPSPANPDFSLCPFRIVGVGDERVRVAGGVDSVQALQLVMEVIGAELCIKFKQNYGIDLLWDAGLEDDLGFPVPMNDESI